MSNSSKVSKVKESFANLHINNLASSNTPELIGLTVNIYLVMLLASVCGSEGQGPNPDPNPNPDHSR